MPTVLPYTILRAPVSPSGGDDPTYGPFAPVANVKVTEIFYGSSVIGPSYAKLEWTGGSPVEDAAPFSHGDQVLIGYDGNWLFGGYIVADFLNLDVGKESLCWKVAGPEWIWGTGGPDGGQHDAINGQMHRKPSADKLFVTQTLAGSTATSAWTDLINISGIPCVFNPANRRNMTNGNVQLALSPPTTAGRIFESEERTIAGTVVADFWTVDQALKTLVELLNYPPTSGIDKPIWSRVTDVVGTDNVLRSVSVEGLGLWEAMIRVCGPQFGFYVDPRPSTNDWLGFQLYFFRRDQGTPANFFLAPRGSDAVDVATC